MGTNYYVAKNLCESCNRYDEEYHIGKSSAGWAFSFQSYRAERLVSWRAWKEFLKNQIIMDEYGDRINYESFVVMIEGHKSPNYVNENGQKNLQHNDAMRNDKYFFDFDLDVEWDDEDGYAFSSREFS